MPRPNSPSASSTAPCYYELIITQNFYKKAAIYGRSLNNRFVFKDFNGGKAAAKLVKGRGGNGLSHFPPKTTDETEAAEAAKAEIARQEEIQREREDMQARQTRVLLRLASTDEPALGDVLAKLLPRLVAALVRAPARAACPGAWLATRRGR